MLEGLATTCRVGKKKRHFDDFVAQLTAGYRVKNHMNIDVTTKSWLISIPPTFDICLLGGSM